MRLERLHIIGFGRWSNRTFEFPKGFSLWVGPNESGKTTLAHAILAGLYGLAKRRSALREVQERYRPWEEQIPFGVELELSMQDCRYRLIRDLDSESLHVFEDRGEGYLPIDATENMMGDRFGLPSPALFLSTLMVSQGDVAAIEDGKLGEAIAAKVASGDEAPSATAAIRWLERALNDLVREGRSEATFSVLQNARHQIRIWQERYDALSESAIREETWVKKLEEIELAIGQKEDFKKTYGPMVQSYDAFQTVHAEYHSARERLEELLKTVSRQDKAATDWEEAQKQWASWSSRGALAVERRPEIERTYVEYCSSMERLEALKSRKVYLLNQLKEAELQSKPQETMEGTRPSREGWEKYLQLKERYSRLLMQRDDAHGQQEHLAKKKRLGFLGAVGILAGLAVIGLSTVIVLSTVGHRSQYGLVIALSLGAIMLLFGLLLVMKGWYAAGEWRKAHLEEETLQTELDQLELDMKGIIGPFTPESYGEAVRDFESYAQVKAIYAGRTEALKETLEQLEEEIQAQEEIFLALNTVLNTAWAEAGAADINDYRQLCQTYDEARQRERLAKEKLEALLQDKSRAEWESAVVDLTASCRILQAKMDELRIDGDALIMEDYRHQLSTVEEELVGLYQEKAVVSDRLAAIRAEQGEEDRYQIAAELEHWKEEEKNVLDRAAGVRRALQLMREASQEVHETLAPILADRAAEIFSRVAKGRYRQLRVASGLDGDEPFRMEVLIPATNQWVDPASLSSGTRDQLYLALRIALADYLTGQKDMPLLLDDPFLHYDPARLSAAVGLLKELGEERQIIWLTKDPRLADEFPGLETVFV